MIAGVTGDKALPQEIAEQIVDRTDGVPLFVEELTKAVVESGMLTDIGDRYTAARAVAPLAIPASLQASLLARLDRLAPVREVAQIGAALGRQFSHELIAAVAPMPQRQLDDGLAQLVGAELMYRRGTPPDAEYTFKHALVQDAAYGTLLRSRRQQLHARIAATLEDRFPEIVAAQPALLAHHCGEAGLGEKAVDYWLAAGRQAWARSATAEAVALFRRGLALVAGLPDGDRRREVEFDLQIGLGQVTIASRGWAVPELGEAYARARELASTLNRPRALLFALYGQSIYHVFRADLERARQLAAEVRDLGESGGDAATQIIGCNISGFIYLEQGDFTAARAYYEAGLAQFDPAYRRFYTELLSYDQLVLLLLHSSQALVSLGDLDRALSRCEAAAAEARRLSDPHSLAIALAYAWQIRRCVGAEPTSLLHCADELLALAVEHELGFYRNVGFMYRGWSLAALGRPDDGVPLLTRGLAGIDAVQSLKRPERLTLLADGWRMAGQLQAALAQLAEARRLAAETGNRPFQAETLRLQGDVVLATGDPAGAEASYHEAIALAQQQNAKLWELHAAMSLARLWRDEGKRSEARELLAPVYDWFTEGFANPVLQEAKALLDDLSADQSPEIGDSVAPGPPAR
jgi:tetratricopeptide (TPR) repeat protein